MTEKIRKVESFISMLKQEYAMLHNEFEQIQFDYEVSSRKIDDLYDEIETNTRYIAGFQGISSRISETNYKIVTDYLKHLFVMLEREKNSNKLLQGKIDEIIQKKSFLKIETKGYDLLLGNYKTEKHNESRRKQDNELDEIWQTKRANYE